MIKITPLPTPPTTNDTASFDIRADAFVEALPQFGEELNSFATQINELGANTEQSLRELESQARENLTQERQGFKAEVESAKKNAIKEILAHTALQSDQFTNIAHHILFTLAEIKAKRQRKQEEWNRIGQYALFFRSSLPQGYKRAGSLLKIEQYPLAYLYFKDTSKSLQEGCPSGYFRLPKPNVYAKGCDETSRIGEFEREGLPDVNAGNYVNKAWRYSLNGKGGGGNDDWGCATSSADFILSKWNSIYGRTNSVEVNHNLYLEGFYVGARISPTR